MDFDSKAAGTSAGSPDIKKGDNVAVEIERRSQAVGAEVHNTSHIGPQADVVGSHEVAGTITASRGTGFRSNGTPIEGVAITPTGPRRFTPRECERLQGFPDGFTAIKFGKKPASDAKRFHALGNSIAVPILIWIGQQITRAFTPDDTPPGSMPTSPGTSQEPKSGLSQSSDVAPVAPAGKATACRDGRPWPVGTDPTESERRQSGTDVRKPRNHERNVK